MNIDYAKLENYLYEKICQYITDVINKKSEVYVVSFLLYTDGGQENNFICYPENKFNGIERFPALCIEYNTECDFENMMLLSGKNSDNIYCKERWGIRFDNFYDVISAADDINAEDETMRMLYESLLESGANADDWLNQINSHSAKDTAESAQFLYDWLIENKITDIGYENMATAFDKDNNYI